MESLPESPELVLDDDPHCRGLPVASRKRVAVVGQGLPMQSVDFLEILEVDGVRLDQDLPA